MFKKYGKYFMLTALAAAVAVSGVSAYFTASDTATNNFTVNKVDVDLKEPEWDKVVDPDGDGTIDNIVTVTPNQTILKNPTVTNEGNVDQFVFLKVAVPFKNITTANLDGSKNAPADIELFTWNAGQTNGAINVAKGTSTDEVDENGNRLLGAVNNGWTLIQRTVNGSNVEYIYAYGSATEMSALAPEASTVALFDSVTMCNVVENDYVEGGMQMSTVQVDVDVYAIQASDLNKVVGAEGTKDPAQVLEIYLNQNAD